MIYPSTQGAGRIGSFTFSGSDVDVTIDPSDGASVGAISSLTPTSDGVLVFMVQHNTVPITLTVTAGDSIEGAAITTVLAATTVQGAVVTWGTGGSFNGGPNSSSPVIVSDPAVLAELEIFIRAIGSSINTFNGVGVVGGVDPTDTIFAIPLTVNGDAVVTSPATASTVASGEFTIDMATIPLSGNFPGGVNFFTPSTNTGTIYLGGSNVSITPPNRGMPLTAGVFYAPPDPITDLSKVYAVATLAGQSLFWIGGTALA